MAVAKRISGHAILQYCLRVYNDKTYYCAHPWIKDEIKKRVEISQPSKLRIDSFFDGNRVMKTSTKGVKLYQDNKLAYVVRDDVVVTVIPIPGEDRLDDMIAKALYKKG